MRYEKVLEIPREKAEMLVDYLTYEPLRDVDCLDEDEVYSFSVYFDDNKEIEIKVCGVQYKEGRSNTAYSEAVLFDENRNEICYTEKDDTLLGKWVLYDDDRNAYVVNVCAKR